jgi:cell division protein FtsI (penicillin-binding protein 3)
MSVFATVSARLPARSQSFQPSQPKRLFWQNLLAAAKAGRRWPGPPIDLPGWPTLVQLEGAAKMTLEVGRTRLVTAGILFLLAFLVLAARVIDLTLFQAGFEPSLARLAASQGGKSRLAFAERQPILDAQGRLLAINLNTVSLYAEPRRVLDGAEAASRLAQTLPELKEAEILAKLGSGQNFVWLKRNLTPRQHDAVNKLGLPGIGFMSEQRRVYPHGALTAHVVGFTDIDNRGLAGVEQFFDAALQQPTEDASPLRLSLDIRIQHVLRQELARAIKEFAAQAAGGLVLDVATGEVLAMVSLPDFDPHRPQTASENARFNRLTLGVFEMGSTMKTLTAAMALDAGAATLASGYDASHPIHVGRFTISDYKPENRWLTVPEIIMHSSNIGAAKMALGVGAAGQREFLGKLGMLRKPPIELAEVGAPLVPHQWKTLETMTIGFGHGLSVSPLQLASAVAAIVNGGSYVPPTLIKRETTSWPLPQQVVRPETSDAVRRLLYLAVTSGTGKKAMAEGYLVGGKTGTSEKVDGRGYNRKALLNTFVAAFPMQRPRYVVLTMLDEPKANADTHGFATAGWTAAPVAGRVIARIGPLLGVEPADADAREIQEALAIEGLRTGGRTVAAN